jgi:hypothetical protein
MSDETDAGMGSDWQCVGVVSMGGAVGLGGQLCFYEFRSQAANCRATFIFVGAGIGLGGDLGGAVAPDPSSVIHNQQPDLWAALKCERPFSANDLNWSYAAMSGINVEATYGYSLCGISAGLVDPLFTDQNVSGWNVGVGATASIMVGVWKRLGTSSAYY